LRNLATQTGSIRGMMYECIFLCCVVLCRQRPCDGRIAPQRNPTKKHS
jgi:hypothetical protein